MARYELHPACRVRREKFGLLFYDLRGPRLTFVETGGLLDPRSLEPGSGVDALAGLAPRDRTRVERLLVSLSKKELVREQPLR